MKHDPNDVYRGTVKQVQRRAKQQGITADPALLAKVRKSEKRVKALEKAKRKRERSMARRNKPKA